MAAIWMYDASLYANVRLFLVHLKERKRESKRKIKFYIGKNVKTTDITLQRQQKMYEISSFHGPP